jgi:hypothetical protein
MLCLESDDQVLAILRFFQWNQDKMDQWFSESDKLSLKIGIKYDDEIKKNHPQVDESKEANNENMCKICFCEFEDEEGWRADSLECGH